jgi:hypothetical protein
MTKIPCPIYAKSTVLALASMTSRKRRAATQADITG